MKIIDLRRINYNKRGFLKTSLFPLLAKEGMWGGLNGKNNL